MNKWARGRSPSARSFCKLSFPGAFLVVTLLSLGTVTIFAGVAVWISAAGVTRSWLPLASHLPFRLDLLLALVLHASWLHRAFIGKNAAVSMIAWVVCFHFCRRGFLALHPHSSAALLALLLEGLSLLLVASATRELTLASLLATWYRGRADFRAQVELDQGLPRLRETIQQALRGSPGSPFSHDYARLITAFTESENHLRVRVSESALPEHLRQSILSAATALLAEAESAAANLSAELEHKALLSAAACRDQCDRLSGYTSQRRAALATECEAILLGLIRRGDQHYQPFDTVPATAASERSS